MTEVKPTPKMRDGIVKRGKTWSYMVRERDPLTGVAKPRWVGGFRTREEAKDARDKARTNVRRGTYAAPSRVTVSEWLDRWLAAQVDLRPSTRAGYVQKIETYLKPKLGHERLQALSAERLTAVWADLVASGGKDGKPLATTSVAPCRMILRKACKDAQGAEGGRLLEVNPVDGSKVPRAARKAAHTTWTPDQQAAFLAATKASRWNPLWTLALATGLRRGELCGLRWQDVDLAKGVVRVERSCVQIGKDVVTNDSTKNGTVRRVSIDKATAAALRDLRKQQAAERLAVATGWGNEEDLVFVWPDGTRVLPDFLTKRVVDEQAGLALPQLRLHDLRHTHATTLLRAGMPVHIVSKRLGHKNVTLTLNTYADVIPDDDTTASDMYASLLATGSAQA